MDILAELGPLALGSRLRRISDRLLKEVAQVYREHNIAFEPRWFPVYFLLRDGSQRTVGEIARTLGFSHPAVVQIANSMQRNGLMASSTGSGDRRTRVLSLSDRGRQMLRELEPMWVEIRETAADLAASASGDFLASLGRLEAAIAEESFHARAKRVGQKKRDEDVTIFDLDPEQPRHVEAFQRLNIEWLEKYFEVEPHDREMLEHPREYIIDRGGYVLLAQSGGEIVGTCALIRHTADQYELAKMAVTEKAQGKQIGKRLAQSVIDRARNLNARSIWLESNSILGPALNLYRKLGFRFEEFPQPSEYRRADVFMRLVL